LKSPSGQGPHYPSTPITFSSGVGSASITLYDAQTTTLSVSDGTVSGSLSGLTVVAGSATQFSLSNPGTRTAGSAFTEVITAKDKYKNTATSYAGTQTLMYSGPLNAPNGAAPTYPPTVTFTGGIGKAYMSLVDEQSTVLTVSDGTISGTSTSFTVGPNLKQRLVLSGAPQTTAAGATFAGLTLTAEDKFNNILTTYTGSKTIIWSGAATSPSGYAPVYPATAVSFTNGASTTSLSATLYTAGTVVLTATASSPKLVGSASIVVTPAGPAQFGVQAPAAPTAGTAFSDKITAQDVYGNASPGYAGTACLIFSGPDSDANGDAPLYPSEGSCAAGQSSVTFTNGVATASITLFDAESTSLSVTDGTIGGTSLGFTVNASTTASLVVSIPPTATNGTPVTANVTAFDQFGNAATGDVSTLSVNSSDAAAAYPSTVSLMGGVASFPITFNTSGPQWVTVTEGAVTSPEADTTVS
jgi:hypothetical protein